MAKGVTVRSRKKEAYWRRMVRGQSGSGLSVRAYCGKHDVKEPAYYWWRAQLACRDAARPRATFVPVRVLADPMLAEGGGIEIQLPKGQRVQVKGPVDKQALADVLAVLEAHPC